MNIPLKLKYRNPNSRRLRRQFDPDGGTLVFNGGTYKAKTSNSGHSIKPKTLIPRKRAYGPF
jgi:hypothetical protein